MITTYRFSATGKTKYFGIEINSEFIKLQSRKASISLINAIAIHDDIVITTKTVSVNGKVISSLTKQNSVKLYNNIQGLNYVTHYSTQQSNRSNHNSTNSQENVCSTIFDEVEVCTKELRATEATVTVLPDCRSEVSLSFAFQASELQYGSQPRLGHKRVLPTDAASFYGVESIDAIIATARAFYRNEPGAIERVEQLRIDISDARAANFIDDDAVEKMEGHFSLEIELCEAESLLCEARSRTRETERLLREARAEANRPRIREQKSKKTTKKHSHRSNKAALR
jgi:ribosomal protein S17E